MPEQATQPRLYAFTVKRGQEDGIVSLETTTRSNTPSGPSFSSQTTIIEPGSTNITSLVSSVIDDHTADLELAGYEVLP